MSYLDDMTDGERLRHRLNMNGGDPSVPTRKLIGEAYDEVVRLDNELVALRSYAEALFRALDELHGPTAEAIRDQFNGGKGELSTQGNQHRRAGSGEAGMRAQAADQNQGTAPGGDVQDVSRRSDSNGGAGAQTSHEIDKRTQSGQKPPEGWKLVPIEPTDAMKEAAFDVLELGSELPQMKDAGFKTGTQARNAIYRAMLAAAPDCPQVGTDTFRAGLEAALAIVDENRRAAEAEMEQLGGDGEEELAEQSESAAHMADIIEEEIRALLDSRTVAGKKS